jgi:hypothetical protein
MAKFRKLLQSRREVRWGEVTLVVIAIAAIAADVAGNLHPGSIIARLPGIPLFLFTLVGYLISIRQVTYDGFRELSLRFDDLAKRTGDTDIVVFETSTEFHEYLQTRFLAARRVKVTHFSSRSMDASDDSYRILAGKLLERGGAYHRVIGDALGADFWKDQQWWLNEYGAQPFVLHYLPSVAIAKHTKLLDLMLIDDAEVCFGGGYRNGLRFPVISIRNREFVQFFADYYEYLIGRSVTINTYDGSIGLEELLSRAEIRWTNGGPSVGADYVGGGAADSKNT